MQCRDEKAETHGSCATKHSKVYSCSCSDISGLKTAVLGEEGEDWGKVLMQKSKFMMI